MAKREDHIAAGGAGGDKKLEGIKSDEPPLCTGSVRLHISIVPRLYGVCRGPACVLERLPQALAGFVSRRIVSGEQRARENQLQSDQ